MILARLNDAAELSKLSRTGETLQARLSIQAVVYRVANGIDDVIVGKGNSWVLADGCDERWLVSNAKVSIKPCLHGVYRRKCSKRLKAFLVLHVSGVCCTGRERCLTIAAIPPRFPVSRVTPQAVVAAE